MAAATSATGFLIDVQGCIPWEEPAPVAAHPEPAPGPEASQPSVRKTLGVMIDEATLKKYAEACEDIAKLSAEQVDWRTSHAPRIAAVTIYVFQAA